MEVISSTIQYVTITPKNFLRNAYYPVSYTLLVLFEVDVIVLADLETNLKAQSWLVACSERVVGGQRHAPCFLHGIHSIVLKFTYFWHSAIQGDLHRMFLNYLAASSFQSY